MAEHLKTPWRTDHMGMHVESIGCEKAPVKILDIRGWGYLTGKGHGALGLSDEEAIEIQKANAAFIVRAANCHAELIEALDALVNAKALAGVREQVAGWNGEHLPEDKRHGAHPAKLGATLPKTNCGAVYALDDAMTRARSVIAKARGEAP